jgi:hypothetical protein
VPILTLKGEEDIYTISVILEKTEIEERTKCTK